jgi:hypothetical protein
LIFGKPFVSLSQTFGKAWTAIVWVDSETSNEDAPLDKVRVDEGGFDLVCVIEKCLTFRHIVFA